MQPARKPGSSALHNSARELVSQLEAGNASSAEKLIEELGRIREQTLFQELGKMTRQLHDALNSFALDSRLQSLADSEIPDAKARLNHVIEMTEESAHRTLTVVEGSLPIAERLQDEASTLHGKWGRFRSKDMRASEFRDMSKEIDGFLAVTRDSAEWIHSSLSEVMMARDFQDLTGQIIRRVITLVQEVEDNLVELIRLSGGIEAEADTDQQGAKRKTDQDSIMRGVDPQVPGVANSSCSVSDQDEVDDLLSSLGF